MLRKAVVLALALVGAAVFLPSHAHATMAIVLNGDSTGFRPILDFNLGNYLSMITRNTTNTINTQNNYITNRNGPPPMGGTSTTYLDSDGNNRVGLSAGDGWPSIGVWTSVAHTDFNDDHPSINVDSDTLSFSFGGDVEIIDNLITGISLSFDDTDSNSNVALPNGLGSSMAEDDTDTFTVAPYVVYIINDMFDVDGSFGFSDSDTDSSRFNGAATVSSSSDTDAWFFAVNGNATYWFDYLGLTGTVGYRRSSATTDGFTESDGTVVASNESTLGTFIGRARATYYYPTGWEFLQAVLPFFSLTAEWDHTKDEADVGSVQTQPTPSDDRFGLVIAGGVNLSIVEGVSAGIEASAIALRADQSSHTVAGNVSVSF